jgi:hypothetical protein
MSESIKGSGRLYHNQADAELFAVEYIKEVGAVEETVLEDAYDEWLRQWHENYDTVYEADTEMVCDDKKERRNKCLENLSNHGVFEIEHDIVTINVREANRLGYKTPGGLKFKGKWYMTRVRAERDGYPVHDTVDWDNNITRLLKLV